MDNFYAIQRKLKEYWKDQQRGDPLRTDEGNEEEVGEQGGPLASCDKSNNLVCTPAV
jgi:hypothetical protein